MFSGWRTWNRTLMGAVRYVSTVKVAWKIRFVVGASRPACVITEKVKKEYAKHFLIQFLICVKTAQITFIATIAQMIRHVNG